MNRLLIISAMRGDDLSMFPIDDTTPDDVRLLHSVLSSQTGDRGVVNIKNCGTAMRFLTAYYAQKEGCSVVLEGTERMCHRPIGGLVDALMELGADIRYLSREGFPPIRIEGRRLRQQKVEVVNPESTQFVSALMLIGADVSTNIRSPYIDMTRELIERRSRTADSSHLVEADWSAAAFWYEYAALHGGTLLLEGLSEDSLQGDKIVSRIFEELGVETVYKTEGVEISRTGTAGRQLAVDFSCCPDLYPAVYATCARLGIEKHFSGLDSLPLKESNRLEAMKQTDGTAGMPACGTTLSSFSDHRIAMALICADYNVDDTECIAKSYPQFMQQWRALHR